nr:helix-turn-helix domain-containing protein [uncultured Methanobrevibacter sp.]
MTKDLITCPIENTLKLLNRKWTIVLIRDMFQGKKYFREFSQIEGLSNTVLSDTLKDMETKNLITKKDSEYHLTSKGLRLNRILYEMAAYGLDELECGDERDLEIIDMFKDYYKKIFKVDDYESGNIE